MKNTINEYEVGMRGTTKPRGIVISVFFILFFFGCMSCTQQTSIDLSTSYFSIQINNEGFITSMKNISVEPAREFSPPDKPSPLMCLYDSKKTGPVRTPEC